MQAVRGKPAGKGRGYHAKNKTGDMPHEAMVNRGSQGAKEGNPCSDLRKATGDRKEQERKHPSRQPQAGVFTPMQVQVCPHVQQDHAPETATAGWRDLMRMEKPVFVMQEQWTQDTERW